MGAQHFDISQVIACENKWPKLHKKNFKRDKSFHSAVRFEAKFYKWQTKQQKQQRRFEDLAVKNQF